MGIGSKLLMFFITLSTASITTIAKESNHKFIEDINSYYRNPDVELSKQQLYEKYSEQAKLGDIQAQFYTFMVFYEFNDTLPHKATEALQYLVSAARNGNHEAQYFLGFLISNGIFVEENVELANKWLKSSAKQGNRQANILLGINLAVKFMSELNHDQSKTLSERDYKEITHYLSFAEETKNAEGILALATVIFFQEQKFEESKRLALLARKLGHDDASEFLEDLIEFENKIRSVLN